MNMRSDTTGNPGVFRIVLDALIGSLRHWRWILLVWIASLLPAQLVSRPITHLIDTAIGPHPDAARIVAENDLALLADALMKQLDDGGNLITGVLPGIGSALLIGALLAPWISGMLVASLRAQRTLGFAELWLGGWREYGRQFRLYWLALIPFALAAGIALLAFGWAGHDAEERLLETITQTRERIALAITAGALMLAYATLESARAALAADPAMRSVFRAWLRGLAALRQRPFSILLIVALSVIASLALAAALQITGLRWGGSGVIVALAQLTVLAMAGLRFTRLCALTALVPKPASASRSPPIDLDREHEQNANTIESTH